MLTITVSNIFTESRQLRFEHTYTTLCTDLTTTKSYSTFVAAPNPCTNSEQWIGGHVINYENRILDFWGQNTGNGLEVYISRADPSSYIPTPILAGFPVYGYLFLLHPRFKKS
jgi:hypothetical protein